MEKEERIEIELSDNSLATLLRLFDKLLLGIDTKKDAFSSKEEKDKIIKKIRSFVKYRLEENGLNNKSNLWKLILEINSSKLIKKEDIEELYKKLLKTNYYESKFNRNIWLQSPKSKYYFQKAKETSKEEGEKIIKKFFEMIER